jgi:hypothetical protein
MRLKPFRIFTVFHTTLDGYLGSLSINLQTYKLSGNRKQNMKTWTILLFIISLLCYHGYSQNTDNTIARKDTLPEKQRISFSETLKRINDRNRMIRSEILPAFLTSYGFVALGNGKLKTLDNRIKYEVWNEHPHQPDHIDDGLQYIPGFSVFVLNGLNLEGKNSLLDATRQYFISSFMMMVVVQSIKKISDKQRPDGSGTNSFPSGHTSTAFVGAEFLNQEYGNQSPWYSIVGYTMATAVGYLRIYNNAHWFRDVVTGAGIGIGVTKFVYWMYPWIKQKYFKKDKLRNTVVMPFYENGVGGLSLSHSFQTQSH